MLRANARTNFATASSLRPFGYQPRRAPLWSTTEAFFSDAGLYLFGVAGLYSLPIMGSLPGYELLLLPLLPALLFLHGKRAFSRKYLIFYLLVGGWFLGTLIADTYNDLGFLNRAKGTARVVFFALDFMTLAILINNRTRRFVIFILSLLTVLFVGSLQMADFSLRWKFGMSHAVTMVALLFAARYYSRQRYGICLLIFLFVAALNFRYGFRSQLLIDIVAATMSVPVFGTKPNSRGQVQPKQGLGRTLLLLTVVMIAANALNLAIKYGAEKGIFEESTNQKFMSQESGDLGVLVGGRPETLVAIQAIRDSPIIGHGSFPYGPQYVQMQQDIQYEHGYSESDEPDDSEYPVIPTHSHLTMAWVESGIFGGICWIVIFVQVFLSVLRLSATRPPLAPLYSYLLVNFLWDILYSPFGSVNRMQAAFLILLSYFILSKDAADNSERKRRSLRQTGRERTIVRLRRAAQPLRAGF